MIEEALVKKLFAERGIKARFSVVECGSTNAYSRVNSVSEDTVFATNQQSEGRGREGREFYSAPGGLYCSAVLKLERIDYSVVHRYPIIAGLAVCRAVRAYGVKAGIKWPNDIVVGGKKLCGILAESSASASTIIIGIGLNVKNELGKYASTAVTLAELQVEVGIERALADIIGELYSLVALPFEDVLQEYRARCVTLGSVVRINESGASGVAVDIDPEGYLTVLFEGKKTRLVNPTFND